jgi:hydroxyacylglutathione hydrolase
MLDILFFFLILLCILVSIAFFVFGLTFNKVMYFLAMKTPLGQMRHEMALARHAQTIHSLPIVHDAGGFLVRSVAYLEDNYAYLIVDKETGRTAVVDPGDATRVLEHLSALQSQWDATHTNNIDSSTNNNNSMSPLASVKVRPELTTALITHYHPDHAGGNKQLLARVPELRIVGSAREAVPCATAVAVHGARFFIGRTEIDVLSTPCHTVGHIIFYAHGPSRAPGARSTPGNGATTSIPFAESAGALFTGDTLFTGGVGRFFEGNAEEMYGVLYGVLRTLPAETPIFPGHEYAVDNLRFALWVDRGNTAVEEKLAWSLGRRAEKRSTIPSLLTEERAYNPFLRAHVASLRARVAEIVRDTRGKEMPEIPVLAALRRLKDNKAHLEHISGKEAADSDAAAARAPRHEQQGPTEEHFVHNQDKGSDL